MKEIKVILSGGKVRKFPSWIPIAIPLILIALIIGLTLWLNHSYKSAETTREENLSLKETVRSQTEAYASLESTYNTLLENLASVEAELDEIKHNFELYKTEVEK